uniref:Uncharacterized protein n=1 Tax=Clandestinovirus TaxID=2831644 RepID=A0A8F8KKH5_9VIRU|nr:hypothetical protein KOM_12_28 [Clandestinovirus]
MVSQTKQTINDKPSNMSNLIDYYLSLKTIPSIGRVLGEDHVSDIYKVEKVAPWLLSLHFDDIASFIKEVRLLHNANGFTAESEDVHSNSWGVCIPWNQETEGEDVQLRQHFGQSLTLHMASGKAYAIPLTGNDVYVQLVYETNCQVQKAPTTLIGNFGHLKQMKPTKNDFEVISFITYPTSIAIRERDNTITFQPDYDN